MARRWFSAISALTLWVVFSILMTMALAPLEIPLLEVLKTLTLELWEEPPPPSWLSSLKLASEAKLGDG